MAKHKIIIVTAKVITPIVPNFLKQEDGSTLPIEAVSDAGLKLVGEAFTQELIEKAQKKRALKAKGGE